ncbi:MAG TPA: acyltransferase [Mycobacteriales bacterium]|nr:acyltransferase [Mycobacteriales bacterium]
MSRAPSRMTLARWRHELLVNRLAGSIVMSMPMRARLLRMAGLDVAAARVRHGCYFGSSDVRLGDDVFVNVGVFFDGVGRIEVGDGVAIGIQSMILTGTHAIGPRKRRSGPVDPRPVVIGAGTWIGARVVILPGVTIGEGCVIAAGSVVTSDCAGEGLYAGVPAKRVRDLAEEGEE